VRASQIVHAAVVQAASIAFDREQTLEKAGDLTADASGRGAQLVVFPEAFVAGYPRGSHFGTVVGARTAEGREEYRRYWESAVDVPGPALDALGEIARANGVYLVMGITEHEGGTLYCTVLFCAPSGHYLGKHRTLMPTAGERLVWGYGDGSMLPVFATEIGNLGAVICWENYMPLLRTAMYGKGIQLYCTPTADGRDSWLATVRHIACEGRGFVLSCNQFARRRDYPVDFATTAPDGPEAVLSRGGSCIIDPLGTVLAGPDYEGETILVADLDLAEIPRAHLDFDAVGHYARPDVFRLEVNELPTPAVTEIAPPVPMESAEPASDLETLPAFMTTS
jgi:nitrilase